MTVPPRACFRRADHEKEKPVNVTGFSSIPGPEPRACRQRVPGGGLCQARLFCLSFIWAMQIRMTAKPVRARKNAEMGCVTSTLGSPEDITMA